MIPEVTCKLEYLKNLNSMAYDKNSRLIRDLQEKSKYFNALGILICEKIQKLSLEDEFNIYLCKLNLNNVIQF